MPWEAGKNRKFKLAEAEDHNTEYELKNRKYNEYFSLFTDRPK